MCLNRLSVWVPVLQHMHAFTGLETLRGGSPEACRWCRMILELGGGAHNYSAASLKSSHWELSYVAVPAVPASCGHMWELVNDDILK